MSDFIEDLFAFVVVRDTVVCSWCGRQLAEGEQYTLDEGNQVVCSHCEEV